MSQYQPKLFKMQTISNVIANIFYFMVKFLCNNDAVDMETYVNKHDHSLFKMTFIIPVSYYSGGSGVGRKL